MTMFLPEIELGWDLLILARRGLSEVPFEKTSLVLKGLLTRARLMK